MRLLIEKSNPNIVKYAEYSPDKEYIYVYGTKSWVYKRMKASSKIPEEMHWVDDSSDMYGGHFEDNAGNALYGPFYSSKEVYETKYKKVREVKNTYKISGEEEKKINGNT